MRSHFRSSALIVLSTCLILATLLGGNMRVSSSQLPFIQGSADNGNTTSTMPSSSASSTTNRNVQTGGGLILTNASGDLASLQDNVTGIPTWLITGKWNMTMPTTAALPRNLTSQNTPMFNASFIMIKLVGTERHKHNISNFNLVSSQVNNNTKSATFKGTATVSLKDGLHTQVPITIRVLNDKGAINIMLDPIKVNGHFGNTPIYGITWRTH
jgi:hypothetical protein